MRSISHRLASPNIQIALLIIFAVVVISSGLGLRDPWTPDEPRFAMIAKQMVETGNWLVPHRGVELYADKPPLFMWAIAVFYKIFGSINIAFLIPSLLASISVLIMVYDITRKLWSTETAFIAAIALLGTYQFGLQAKAAQIDMVLTFFTTLALYGLIRTFFLQHTVGWIYLSFFSMGLGTLTKGVGFLPLLFIVPYVLSRLFKWKYVQGKPVTWQQWGLATGCLIIPLGFWLGSLIIYAYLTSNIELNNYLDNILFHQTKVRYFNSWTHIRPPWYLFTQALQLWMPLILLLPWLIVGWYKQYIDKDSRALSLLAWVLLVLVFFSLSPGKRGVYILPALPGFVIACSAGLIQFRKSLFANLIPLVAIIILSILLICLPLACNFTNYDCKNISDEVSNLYILISVLGTIGLSIAALTRQRNSAIGIFVFVMTYWFLMGWWGYPNLNKIKSERYIVEKTVSIIGHDAELGFVAWREAFMLYTDRSIKDFGFSKPIKKQAKEAKQWLTQKNNRWLLIRESSLECCFNTYNAIHIGTHERRNWYLINSS